MAAARQIGTAARGVASAGRRSTPPTFEEAAAPLDTAAARYNEVMQELVDTSPPAADGPLRVAAGGRPASPGASGRPRGRSPARHGRRSARRQAVRRRRGPFSSALRRSRAAFATARASAARSVHALRRAVDLRQGGGRARFVVASRCSAGAAPRPLPLFRPLLACVTWRRIAGPAGFSAAADARGDGRRQGRDVGGLRVLHGELQDGLRAGRRLGGRRLGGRGAGRQQPLADQHDRERRPCAGTSRARRRRRRARRSLR